MDWFDLIPIVPPSLPGARSSDPGQRIVGGVASVGLPTISFILVLFAGFAEHTTVALAVMPMVAALIVLLFGRWLEVSTGWTIALALGGALFCFISNACALFLVGLAHFFHDF